MEDTATTTTAPKSKRLSAIMSLMYDWKSATKLVEKSTEFGEWRVEDEEKDDANDANLAQGKFSTSCLGLT